MKQCGSFEIYARQEHGRLTARERHRLCKPNAGVDGFSEPLTPGFFSQRRVTHTQMAKL